MKINYFFIAIFFITSCSYESYNDCVKEEIKKNNGKENSYIFSYCKEKFPPPSNSELTQRIKALEPLKFKNLPLFIEENEREITWNQNGVNISVDIKNLSNDKTISGIRLYFGSLKDEECGSAGLVLKDEDYHYRFPSVPPRKSTTISLTEISPVNCMFYNVKGE